MIQYYLPPSSASLWMNCPSSAQTFHSGCGSSFSETTAQTKEGTQAHELAAAKLKKASGQLSDSEYNQIVQKIQGMTNKFAFQKMDSDAEKYVKSIRNIGGLKTENSVEVERLVTLSNITGSVSGRADCVIASDAALAVIDYKYGEGITVSEKDNPQLMIYALGVLDSTVNDVKRVLIGIFQHGELRAQIITVEELMSWKENKLVPALDSIQNDHETTKAGDWCQKSFCPYRNTCHETWKKIGIDKDLKDFTVYDCANGLDFLSQLASLKDTLRDLAVEKAQVQNIPGYQLHDGKNCYKIADEEEAAIRLRSAGYSDVEIFKLKSRAELETIIGKRELSNLLGDIIQNDKQKPQLIKDKTA